MNGPETSALKRAPTGRKATIGLMLMALVICAMRLPSLYEPIEHDMATYMVIGWEMLHGRTIYSEVWELKPPLISLTCSAGILAFGYEEHTIFILGLFVSILTLLGVYFAALNLGGRMAAVLAALFWTVIQADVRIQANLPNAEVFVNVSLVFALGVLLRWQNVFNCVKWKRALLVGALFAAASMYKQLAFVFAAFLGIAHLFSPQPKKRFYEVLIMASVGILTWATFFVFLFVAGIYEDYVDCGIRFIQGYAGNQWMNITNGWALQNLAPHFVLFMAPLALLTVCAFWFKYRTHRRNVMLLVSAALAAQIAMSLPGHFYPHYYQYWMPVLAIGAGWGGEALLSRWPRTGARKIAYIVMGVVVTSISVYELSYYRMTPTQWSRMKYGSLFISARKLAPTIEFFLKDNETFYNWGAESALYIYTKRPIPTSIFHFYPLLYDTPVREKFSRSTIDELKETRPEMAVIFKGATPEAHSFFDLRMQPVLKWVYDNYVPIPYGNKEFELRALKGGSLEKRLEEGTASMPQFGGER